MGVVRLALGKSQVNTHTAHCLWSSSSIWCW